MMRPDVCCAVCSGRALRQASLSDTAARLLSLKDTTPTTGGCTRPAATPPANNSGALNILQMYYVVIRY